MNLFKKGLSTFVVLTILASFLCFSASASELTSVTIDAKTNVLSFVDKVTGTDKTPETPEEWAGGGYMIRDGESITYSLPNGMKEGTYLLTAKIANYSKAYTAVVVNKGTEKEYEVATDLVPPSTSPQGDADGSMQYHTVRTLGKVVLSGENDTLTFGVGKWYVTVLKEFTLTYVSKNKVYEVHYDQPVDFHHQSGNTVFSNTEEYIATGGKDVLPKIFTIRPASSTVNNYYTLPVKFLDKAIYDISFEAASGGNMQTDIYAGETIESVDNLKAINIAIPNSNDWNTLVANGSTGSFYLGENMNYIKFVAAGGGASQIYGITFTEKESMVYEVGSQSNIENYVHQGYTLHTGISSNGLKPIAALRATKGNYYNFNVFGIAPGTYKLYASYMSQSDYKFNLLAGSTQDNFDKTLASNINLPINGTWSTRYYETTGVLGEIYIDENINYIQIAPISGVTQLEKFILVKVSDNNMLDEYTFNYNDTISQVPGEGFYGKKSGVEITTFEPELVTLKTHMAAVRQGYWFKYDISNVPAGKYTVVISGGSYLEATKADIFINDELVLNDIINVATDSYANIKTEKNIVVGTIEVPELAEGGKNILKLLGVAAGWNLKSITLTKNPYVNVAYKTGTNKTTVPTASPNVAYEGNMYFDAYPGREFENKEVLVTFAVYKENNETGEKELYKVYSEKALNKDKFTGVVENIEFEDGYNYSQKVHIWDYETLQGFSF